MLFEPGEQKGRVGPVAGRGVLGSCGLAVSAPLTWKPGHFVTAARKRLPPGAPT